MASKTKEEINALLDERLEHMKKIDAIDAQMADIMLNHSDAESWEEIHNYYRLITPTYDNPLIKQRMLEEAIVHSVDENLKNN